MKNIEIVTEVLADQTVKLHKLINEQETIVKDFSISIEKASKIELQVPTERLEEVISYWNQLFSLQKNQIQELQNNQNSENKKQRLWIFMMLILTIILLLSILLILTFKTI